MPHETSSVELNIPVYLEPDVAKVVLERAREKDTSIGAVVTDWLRRDIRSASHPTRQRVR